MRDVGLSASTAAMITAFLIIGFLLAGLLFQPRSEFDAWQVKASDFPMNGSNEEKMKFLLNYAILAPSSYNSQPWKFNISRDMINISSDKTRGLTVADADQRELYISLGCALENLLIAADHFGYRYQVLYFPDVNKSDFIASIRLVPVDGLGKSNSGVFEAIVTRHSSDQPYANRMLQENEMRLLNNSSSEDGFYLTFTSDPIIRKEFRDLVVQSDQTQFGNVEYRSELGYWLGQGVLGPTGIQAKLAQFSALFLDIGKDQTKKDDDLLNSTSILGFVSSNENDRTSQIKSGQILERLWLTATTLNISIQPMSQILEVPETKSEMTKVMEKSSSMKGVYLQQALRIGYAPLEVDNSSRRPLKEVLN